MKGRKLLSWHTGNQEEKPFPKQMDQFLFLLCAEVFSVVKGTTLFVCQGVLLEEEKHGACAARNFRRSSHKESPAIPQAVCGIHTGTKLSQRAHGTYHC